MTAVLVGLGSNLGDRQANLEQALRLLAATPNVRLVAASGLHATHPIGGPAGQNDFLNAAALFETSHEPAAFFGAMQEIETAMGRLRGVARWSPRIIDLDLLIYGSHIDESAGLTIPHPRMAFRRFVVEPAAEAAPSLRHPTIGWTLAELRDHLRTAPAYVAIAAAPGAGKTQLAAVVSRSSGIRLLEDPAARPDSAPANQPQSAGASGPNWDAEIELLNLRTAQLAKGAMAAAEGTAVSDYWFDQGLCFAALRLSSDQRNGYSLHWEESAAKVMRPKLLVLLDGPLDELWKRVDACRSRPEWLNRQSFAELRQAISDRAMAPGRGPLLRLDTLQPEDARIELVAAIEAMNA